MSATLSHAMSRLKACAASVAAFGAVIIVMGTAVGPVISETRLASSGQQCDRMTGSTNDLQRNSFFQPVDKDTIVADTAISVCQQALSETGDPRFAFQLGRAFDRKGETAKAVNAYAKASEGGYAIAMVHLGIVAGRMGDLDQEFQLFKRATEAGNPLAAYNLGVLYRDGQGTPVDAGKAITAFEIASAHGYGTAAFNIGVIYDEGKIVPEDNRKAVSWYRIGADRGEVDAMVNLGLMLESGEGVDKDLLAAADLFKAAADKGDAFSAAKLPDVVNAAVAQMAPPAETDPDHADMLLLRGDDLVVASGADLKI